MLNKWTQTGLADGEHGDEEGDRGVRRGAPTQIHTETTHNGSNSWRIPARTRNEFVIQRKHQEVIRGCAMVLGVAGMGSDGGDEERGGEGS